MTGFGGLSGNETTWPKAYVLENVKEEITESHGNGGKKR